MTRSYDLIVVGAGTAGLPCALEAAEAGARVALLEKGQRIGGTLHTSGGHMSAGGTSRQLKQGIQDSPEAHWQDVLRISHGTVREDLARRAVELAPAAMDWLDDLGFEWAPETPRIVYGHEPYEVARTVYGKDEARTLLALFGDLLESRSSAKRIDVALNARVTDLVTKDGRVIGVEAEVDGESLTFLAPATVLATGGYASNPELFEELESRPLVSAAEPSSTGDGLQMARELGAEVRGKGKFLPTFGGLPAPDDPERAQWADRPLLVAAERQPWEIWVDSEGRRFVREDEESMHLKEEALVALTDLTFFEIFDDRAPDESPDMVVGWSAEALRSQADVREGISSAPSLRELAKKIGLDPETLIETVDAYNAGVAAGEDALGREFLPGPIDHPPFYAMRNHGISLISFCGVDVTEELKVRRTDGGSVEGLYAVGEILGAGAFCGRSFVGGMMVGPAISLGRELGARLARICQTGGQS